jgi:ADP-ribose pyrophosphatase YjhB (NUDIX family)
LLVRTRGGRWIFPKGGAVPGLTHAQSAALEAFEEAGVHGRIEQTPFARYHHFKPGKDSPRSAPHTKRYPVIAHLCEVSHLEPPQEAKREPTWFSPEKAKRRLLEDRIPEFGDELAGVLDRAVLRIRRLETSQVDTKKDELHHAKFERPMYGSNGAAPIRYLLLERRAIFSSARVEVGTKPRIRGSARNILQLEGTNQLERVPLRLGSGTLSTLDAKSVADETRTISSLGSRTGSAPTKPRNSSFRKRSA